MTTEELKQKQLQLQNLLDNQGPDKVSIALGKFFKREFVTVEEFSILKERYPFIFADQTMMPWGEVITKKGEL